jgi:hypothetical protein
LRRLFECPEVRDAAVVNTRPFLGWQLGARLHVPGRPLDATREDPIVSLRVVSPGYLLALGAPLLRGRGLMDSDGPTNAPVALVNETMARHFWPNEDPLGKRFSTKPLGSTGSDWPWWPEQRFLYTSRPGRSRTWAWHSSYVCVRAACRNSNADAMKSMANSPFTPITGTAFPRARLVFQKTSAMMGTSA